MLNVGKVVPIIAHAPRVERTSAAEEGAAIFEQACKRYLNVSTEEFLERWEKGDFRDTEIAHRAADVALLLPLMGAR